MHFLSGKQLGGLSIHFFLPEIKCFGWFHTSTWISFMFLYISNIVIIHQLETFIHVFPANRRSIQYQYIWRKPSETSYAYLASARLFLVGQGPFWGHFQGHAVQWPVLFFPMAMPGHSTPQGGIFWSQIIGLESAPRLTFVKISTSSYATVWGWKTSYPGYVGYIVNHEIRLPSLIKQSGFHGK